MHNVCIVRIRNLCLDTFAYYRVRVLVCVRHKLGVYYCVGVSCVILTCVTHDSVIKVIFGILACVVHVSTVRWCIVYINQLLVPLLSVHVNIDSTFD